MPTVDHCLKGCKLETRTAKGLVAKPVLAKGLSEKGLLLADITAPTEGYQNAYLQQPSEPKTVEDTTLYCLTVSLSLTSAAKILVFD